MPSARTTYLLLALVVFGLGYLFFFERHAVTTDAQARSSRRVVSFTADDVERVKLRRDAWTSALLERLSATEYRLLEPSERRIEGALAARLLSALEFLDSRGDLGDGDDPVRAHGYGLSPARLIVNIALRSGEEMTLELGKETPLADGMYVRIAGSPHVHLVDKGLFVLFDEALDRLVASADPTLAQQDGE
jgi:hypothetical protein